MHNHYVRPHPVNWVRITFAFVIALSIAISSMVIPHTNAPIVAAQTNQKASSPQVFETWGERNFQLLAELLNHSYKSVSAGRAHSVALTTDGYLKAWGDNARGQGSIPTDLKNLTFKAVSAGNSHNVALTTDGRLKAWGNNSDGQGSVPEDLKNLKFQAVAAGSSHNVAITSDGHLKAWGSNRNGEINIPEELNGLTFQEVSSGLLHNVALTTDGKLKAWGSTTSGRSRVPADLEDLAFQAVSAGSYHNVALTVDGDLKTWGDDTNNSVKVPEELKLLKFKAISGGSDHSLALTTDGKVKAWGRNSFGQGVIPAELKNLTFNAISAGGSHNLALTADGQLRIWGSETVRPQQRLLAELVGQTLQTISAGHYHSVALTNDGHLRAWGDNAYGRASIPAELEFLTFQAISAGGNHNLALTTDGRLKAWGGNYANLASVPAELENLTFQAISAGGDHNLALTTDGHLKTWDGSYGLRYIPAELEAMTFQAISAGGSHNLALTTDGHLKAWGGDDADLTSIPAELENLTFQAISAGDNHNLVLTADGHLKAWGDSNSKPANVPAELETPTFQAISAGRNHNLALTTDGHLIAWGDNTHGQGSVPLRLQNKRFNFIEATANNNFASGNWNAPVLREGASPKYPNSWYNSVLPEPPIPPITEPETDPSTEPEEDPVVPPESSISGLSDTEKVAATWDSGNESFQLIGPKDAKEIPHQGNADDTDGDGLPDVWEGKVCDGVHCRIVNDTNYQLKDHEVDLRESKVGQKDLYLYLDWEVKKGFLGFKDESTKPTKWMQNRLIGFFSNAPVENKDPKARGIKLHLKVPDEGFSDFADSGTSQESSWDLKGDNLYSIPKEERQRATDITLPLLRQAREKRLSETERKIYRYGLIFRDSNSMLPEDEKGSTRGISEIAGPVFAAKKRGDSERFTNVEVLQTIIHEFGHSLGLGHGGPFFRKGVVGSPLDYGQDAGAGSSDFESALCKPNYVSSMNYMYMGGSGYMNRRIFPYYTLKDEDNDSEALVTYEYFRSVNVSTRVGFTNSSSITLHGGEPVSVNQDGGHVYRYSNGSDFFLPTLELFGSHLFRKQPVFDVRIHSDRYAGDRDTDLFYTWEANNHPVSSHGYDKMREWGWIIDGTTGINSCTMSNREAALTPGHVYVVYPDWENISYAFPGAGVLEHYRLNKPIVGDEIKQDENPEPFDAAAELASPALLATDTDTTVSLAIFNPSNEDSEYEVTVSVDDREYTEKQRIPANSLKAIHVSIPAQGQQIGEKQLRVSVTYDELPILDRIETFGVMPANEINQIVQERLDNGETTGFELAAWEPLVPEKAPENKDPILDGPEPSPSAEPEQSSEGSSASDESSSNDGSSEEDKERILSTVGGVLLLMLLVGYTAWENGWIDIIMRMIK